MVAGLIHAPDLTPPSFAEGLCDWSRGDGTPTSTSYETCEAARIARADADFGDCLELRTIERAQRLRYMGELPIRRGAVVEVRVRLKALRGPLPAARVAAWAGGLGGRGLTDLPGKGPLVALVAHETVTELRLVIARSARPGVTLVWDERALYAHVGLDLVGVCGAVVRIEDLQVREIGDERAGAAAALPGFVSASAEAPGR